MFDHLSDKHNDVGSLNCTQCVPACRTYVFMNATLCFCPAGRVAVTFEGEDISSSPL